MSNKITKSLTTEGLVSSIDISNISSWDLNSGLSVVSLNQWDLAISKTQTINDFGLTAIDNGRTDNPYNKLILNEGDKSLSLFRIGEYTPNGVDYSNYAMSGVTDQTIGNYFTLDGGYLQGFFKLDGYSYEVLPSRYGSGVTLETLIYLDQDTKGILFFLGTRSEDKYNSFYEGEVNRISTEVETTVPNGVLGQTHTKVETVITYSGVTTSEGNYLNSIKYVDQQKKAIRNLDEPTESVEIFEEKNSINDNAVAIGIDVQKRLFYRYVNENGITRELTTTKILTTTGWTTVTFTYTPNVLLEEDDPKCSERRIGTISFYINGRLFESIDNINEFYFTAISNTRDKQIGVPYNISWGGGSEGLKNSYHFDGQVTDLYTGNTQQNIDDNFTVLSGETTPSNNLTLLNDNITFSENVIEVVPTSGTSFSDNYFIRLNEFIDVKPNKDYVFSVSIFDSGIFSSSLSEIKLVLLGSDGKLVKTQTIYSPLPNMSDDSVEYKRGLNEWHILSSKILLEENDTTGVFQLALELTTITDLNLDKQIYLRNFEFLTQDLLVKDPDKSNLTIENGFADSFNGSLQKLRIYNRALNSGEILDNTLFESTTKPININKGGRLIYR